MLQASLGYSGAVRANNFLQKQSAPEPKFSAVSPTSKPIAYILAEFFDAAMMLAVTAMPQHFIPTRIFGTSRQYMH
jgi:hypothetical protein